MIDFTNARCVKLSAVDPASVLTIVGPLLVTGEEVEVAAKGMRDFVAFTNKRIFAVNVQGMTGAKKDITSLPYSKIQTFSIESAGTFDRDCELTLWLSGLGQVKFEFGARVDITRIAQIIGDAVLS